MPESLREFSALLASELGHDEFIALLQSLAVWGLLGAGLGLLLGFASYRLFRQLGWYGAHSTTGRWLQRGVFAAVAATCAVLLGGAGFWEGVHRRCHDVVTRSRIGTDALPVVADLCAEGIVRLDLAMEPGVDASTAAGDARLTAFRAGTWELDAPKFLGRIDTLRGETFRELLAGFERDALDRAPALKGGLTERLLHYTTQNLGTALLEQKLSSELRRRGLDHLHTALRTGLVAEAARTGNPATIGHRDLARFIQREGIVPTLVVPIRSFARSQQNIYALVAAFACIAPAAMSRLCRSTPPVASGADSGNTLRTDAPASR
ncbi:MAG TPA: hypothetical protein VHO24_09215 [Opitutaceae bacterium]|nr:hypothetical protein [Opitutaceae bacterium]